MKALKITYKIVSVIISVILALLLVSNLYLIINKHFLKNPYPNIFGYSTAVVISGSMEPNISVNDMIIIKEQNEYKKGDVISFIDGKSLVTHRIADVTDAGFITKGDANNAEDKDPVTSKQIAGKVVFTIPYVGLVLEYLQSPLGIMILILGAFAIIALPSFFKNEEEKK